MNILYLLIPLASLVVFFFIGLFLWCAKSGQYDDLDGSAFRSISDTDTLSQKTTFSKKNNANSTLKELS